MAIAELPTAERSDLLATPLTLAFAWTEAISEIARASVAMWTDIARTYGRASEAYAELVRRAIDLEGLEALTLSDGADRVLQDELRLVERGTEHLVYAAEEVLVDLAGRPLVPLPE
jgi:hypothetical protein